MLRVQKLIIFGEIHLQNILYVYNMFYSGSKYFQYQKKHSLSKKIYILHSFDEKNLFSESIALFLFLSHRICRLDGKMADMGWVGEMPSDIFQ